MLGFYRILSYLLLPVALFMGIVSLVGLLMAFGNLPLLLPVFLTACTTIYIVAAFMFLQKGIEAGKPCKPSLRDWIRANAFVCLFFCFSLILQSFYLLRQPQLIGEMLEKAAAMQGAALPADQMLKYMKGVLIFMLVLGIAMIVHIVMSFRLLRSYAVVFGGQAKPDRQDRG
jgi:hypothetical protein